MVASLMSFETHEWADMRLEAGGALMSVKLKILTSASIGAVVVALQFCAPSAGANDKLIELSKSNENWVMPGRNYDGDNYSPDNQINTGNVKDLKVAWSFSTGVLNSTLANFGGVTERARRDTSDHSRRSHAHFQA